jgi:opacity protein-like surface antigen
MKIHPFFLFIPILLCSQTFAQVFSNKEVGKKNAALADTLKKSEYPYALPILGAAATKKGYNLPYSAGVSLNYFWQNSDLVIDNLEVGFNDGPMYNLDGLVRFNKAQATAQALTVRPDIWLFPFLNIYGILGKASASTEVGVGVWIPDSSGNDKEILSFNSNVKFNTTTYGLGMTPTIGIGGGFMALDMNCSWTDVPQLDKPAFSYVIGPRFGKNFKLKVPERTLAVWAGGFRVAIKSGTSGSMNLSEVLPPIESGNKIDNAIIKVEDAQQQVDAWWAGLSPTEQNNPVNKAKYNRANDVLDRAGNVLDGLSAARDNVTNSTVQYKMDKRVKDAWNFIIGTQFQLNKHWMVRAEYGFLGSRTQVMTGVQYRFGL